MNWSIIQEETLRAIVKAVFVIVVIAAGHSIFVLARQAKHA
jgi:hypothetical protein